MPAPNILLLYNMDKTINYITTLFQIYNHSTTAELSCLPSSLPYTMPPVKTIPVPPFDHSDSPINTPSKFPSSFPSTLPSEKLSQFQYMSPMTHSVMNPKSYHQPYHLKSKQRILSHLHLLIPVTPPVISPQVSHLNLHMTYHQRILYQFHSLITYHSEAPSTEP